MTISTKFEIYIFFFFRKSFEKIQVSLNSDKNNGRFPWRHMYIYDDDDDDDDDDNNNNKR
jgi:hypothetical protein